MRSLVLVLLAAGSLHAQTPAPCSATEYRQFDFWLGDWDVVGPNGNPAGTNSISRILGGCVLQEHWKGAGGGEGMSFNTYDASRHLWHQTWVDDHGSLLELDGALAEGRMVLSGTTAARRGGSVLNRITWSRLDDTGSRVRQLWETSSDGGKTWTTSFDGTYRKRG